MGSGKTSAAKRLANKLGYDFYDMDEMLEKEYRISIPDLFQKYDENLFRKLEQGILEKTFTFKNTVIATGGGTPCFEDNIKNINEHGVSVYLKMSAKMLYDRLKASSRPRPLMLKIPEENRLKYIEELLTERERFYLQARFTVDAKNIDIDTMITMMPSV